VHWPHALEPKYPGAHRQWISQYVFPATQRTTDPLSQRLPRHDVGEKSLRVAVQKAMRLSGIRRQPVAIPSGIPSHNLLECGSDIQAVEELHNINSHSEAVPAGAAG
jgi:hypothetical protein